MNIFRIVVFFLESEIKEKFHSLFSESFLFVFGNEEYLLIDRRLKYCSPLPQEVSSQMFFMSARGRLNLKQLNLTNRCKLKSKGKFIISG